MQQNRIEKSDFMMLKDLFKNLIERPNVLERKIKCVHVCFWVRERGRKKKRERRNKELKRKKKDSDREKEKRKYIKGGGRG